MEKKDNEIGCLWKKNSKNGSEYFSGIVNGEKITVFKNYNKSKNTHPDYVILKQEPIQQNQNNQGGQVQFNQLNQNAKKINDLFNDDNIPF